MRPATLAMLALAALLHACGSGERTPSPSPLAPPAPPPSAPPSAPPSPPRPPRPPDAPCAMTAEVAGDVFDRTEYEYGGPATCTAPPELLLPGCPTMMHDLSPRAPEREALFTFTYGAGGRLERWTATHPSSGEVMEDATVTYDAHGRPTTVVRGSAITVTWYGWARDPTTNYTWGRHDVVQQRGTSQVTYQLDAHSRPTGHEVQYEGSATTTARWFYVGDRLDRIESTGTSNAIDRFVYDCPQ